MTEDELIERLARAACIADGRDPDAGVETGCTPSEGPPLMALWRIYGPKAHQFLAMMKAYEEAQRQSGRDAARAFTEKLAPDPQNPIRKMYERLHGIDEK